MLGGHKRSAPHRVLSDFLESSSQEIPPPARQREPCAQESTRERGPGTRRPGTTNTCLLPALRMVRGPKHRPDPHTCTADAWWEGQGGGPTTSDLPDSQSRGLTRTWDTGFHRKGFLIACCHSCQTASVPRSTEAAASRQPLISEPGSHPSPMSRLLLDSPLPRGVLTPFLQASLGPTSSHSSSSEWPTRSRHCQEASLSPC